MRKYAMEVIVGVSVFLAIIITVASYLYFSEVPLGSEQYSVNILFSDVTGLEQNDPVAIAGVRVGRVKEIRLEGSEVRVRIEVDRNIQLPEDTRATIKSLGMVGEKLVEISPGKSSRLLADGDTLHGTNPGDLSTLVPSLHRLVKQAYDTLVELRSMVATTMDEKTRNSLQQSIRYSASIAEAVDRGLKQNMGRWDTIFANLEDLSTQMNDLAKTKRPDVERTLTNLADGSDRAGLVLSRLDSSLAVVNGILAHIQSGRSSLSNVLYSDELYSRVDSLTSEVQSLLQDFKRRPQRYLDLNFIRIF